VKITTISGKKYQYFVGMDSASKKDLHDLKPTDKITDTGENLRHFSGSIGQCKQSLGRIQESIPANRNAFYKSGLSIAPAPVDVHPVCIENVLILPWHIKCILKLCFN